MSNIDKILSKISTTRMADNLWTLLNIPSPTGKERQAALHFAQMLTDAGAKVKLDETIFDSPNVIARLKGNRQGKTIQLAGHIDHINVPHSAPTRDKDIISGRGSADMKNGLVGILEILEVLKNTGCDFPGQILVTVYGLHEAPEGDFSGLLGLLEQGIKADAAVIFEGPNDKAAIMANGMSIWNLKMKHNKQPCHELSALNNRSALFRAGVMIAEALYNKDEMLAKQMNAYPLLPAESLFIGQMHCGDFYNRTPDLCTLQGTRRWHPDKSFDLVKEDFQQMIQDASLPEEIQVKTEWFFVGDSYEISPNEQIVQSLCRSYEAVLGKQMPVGGHSSVTDACRLAGIANVPTVLWGFGTETGHSNHEYVKVNQLEASCKVAMLTVLDYLENNCS
jgi:acetylornithine deacetylase/succinyl-diaminopimelate desuccinylase-like protein